MYVYPIYILQYIIIIPHWRRMINCSVFGNLTQWSLNYSMCQAITLNVCTYMHHTHKIPKINEFFLFSEPKKDKLENGGEMMRPERPNSLTAAGKVQRRICYQGDGKRGVIIMRIYIVSMRSSSSLRNGIWTGEVSCFTDCRYSEFLQVFFEILHPVF